MLRLALTFLAAITARLGAVEGAAYLKGSEGVRSAALAGAFASVPGSAESLWYNPAGLSGLRGAEASFTHSSVENAFDSDHIAAGAFLGWQHSFGLLYSRKAAADSYRDASANSVGSFEVSNSVLGLGYAYDLGWLSLGLSVKFLSEKVEKLSGSSMAYDIGAQGGLDKDRVIYGLSLQNLGSAPQLGGPEVSLPMALRSGLGWKAGDAAQQLLLLADYRWLFESARGNVALGAEYSEAYEESNLALRAGWDIGSSQLGGLSGLSLGAGFGYKFLGVDYSWSPLDTLGSSHRIALTLTYDQKAAEQKKSMDSYLGIDPNARILPTPTPTPTPKIKALGDAHIGAELSALMAESPTPTPTHTPEVVAAPKEAPKGIIGAIFSIFSFGKKEEPKAGEPERKGGILRGFFSIFGLGSSDDAPATLPDAPDKPENHEDDFVDPADLPSALATPQPGVTPTPVVTPVLKKVKGWLSF